MFITKDEAFVAAIPIPQSQSGDTVTYVIYRASTGAVFQSGSMTFVADEMWKVTFVPNSYDSYILKVYDSTINSKREDVYNVTASVMYISKDEQFVAVVPIPESAAGHNVTYAIYRGSTGALVASGSMTFIADELWKVAFTPTAYDTYIVKATDVTIDSKRESIYVTSQSTADDAVPTAQQMLDNVTRAINALTAGKPVQSYSIGGRNIQYMSLNELRELRKALMEEVASVSFSGRSYIKFGNHD